MTDLLHVAALLPAALGACCTAGRQRTGAELGAALVMLVVMIDLALGVVSVPPIVWTAVLVATALVMVGLDRRTGAAHDAVPARPPRGAGAAAGASARAVESRPRGMTALAAVGSLVMAGLAALMSAPAGVATAASSVPAATGHHGAASLVGALPAVVLAAAAVFTVVVAVSAVRAGRERRSWLEITEWGSMAAAVVLMSLAVSLA